MSIETGPESRKRFWSPEMGPRPGSRVEDMDIQDVYHLLEVALEDPEKLSVGDVEVLEYWIPILETEIKPIFD